MSTDYCLTLSLNPRPQVVADVLAKPCAMMQIGKKAKMPYAENTTLIGQCTLNTVYTADQREIRIRIVREALPAL